MATFETLEDMDVAGKTVLVRVDLNVPMHAGKVTDDTRIRRVLPTIRFLADQHAKVVLLSHFGRPKGKYDPTMSLAPLIDPLQDYLGEAIHVNFGPSCVGAEAREAVANTNFGDVVLLENLRFHSQESEGDDEFAQKLAELADVFVNDAFSCAHRAHASMAGVPKYLPTCAGLSMQKEVETLHGMFTNPERPLAAVVGGAKVSTKLTLLENLVEKVDILIIGGAMANTFLAARGHDMGASLCEHEMTDTALKVIKKAAQHKCELLLPVDMVVTEAFAAHASNKIVGVNAIPSRGMALDVGPDTTELWGEALRRSKTVVWNGPAGAFETAPFDVSTVQLARIVASQTRKGLMQSVAGGGDTVAALSHAGLRHEFTYLSTAGGAFLEWLEGKMLPGVEALSKAA